MARVIASVICTRGEAVLQTGTASDELPCRTWAELLVTDMMTVAATATPACGHNSSHISRSELSGPELPGADSDGDTRSMTISAGASCGRLAPRDAATALMIARETRRETSS